MTAFGPMPACFTFPGRSSRKFWRGSGARSRPAGHFYASYKTGDADGRDTLNRYYNYPSPDWLRATYAKAGNWSSLSIETGDVTGFDGKRAAMLFVTARKSL